MLRRQQNGLGATVSAGAHQQGRNQMGGNSSLPKIGKHANGPDDKGLVESLPAGTTSYDFPEFSDMAQTCGRPHIFN
ncbi:hypothetical protein D3C87_1899580 [compost metagenome]